MKEPDISPRFGIEQTIVRRAKHLPQNDDDYLVRWGSQRTDLYHAEFIQLFPNSFLTDQISSEGEIVELWEKLIWQTIIVVWFYAYHCICGNTGIEQFFERENGSNIHICDTIKGNESHVGNVQFWVFNIIYLSI